MPLSSRPKLCPPFGRRRVLRQFRCGVRRLCNARPTTIPAAHVEFPINAPVASVAECQRRQAVHHRPPHQRAPILPRSIGSSVQWVRAPGAQRADLSQQVRGDAGLPLLLEVVDELVPSDCHLRYSLGGQGQPARIHHQSCDVRGPGEPSADAIAPFPAADSPSPVVANGSASAVDAHAWNRARCQAVQRRRSHQRPPLLPRSVVNPVRRLRAPRRGRGRLPQQV